MSLHIHNVRLGLATNSSSTHSLIFIPPGLDVRDTVGDEPGEKYVSGPSDFGWQYFVARSLAAKKRYVALQLWYALVGMTTRDIAEAVIRQWCGDEGAAIIPETAYADLAGSSGYIDHQSVYDLPADWSGRGPDWEFFEAYAAFILQDDVAVLGGNDNGDYAENHPVVRAVRAHDAKAPGPFELVGPYDCAEQFVCRRDPKHGYWTLFSRKNGAKIRMSFERPALQDAAGDEDSSRPRTHGACAPTKAYAPELVDIKITDFCGFGCSFCYQDSTRQGAHADEALVRHLAYELAKAKVFEVALGGGEPTTHPKFVDILEVFRRKGITPNFTTKSLAWLREPAKRNRILDAMGGFAFSVQTAKDVRALSGALTENGIEVLSGERYRVSVQHVMGTTCFSTLREILRTARALSLHVTLLGYKQVGRGHDHRPLSYSKWLSEVVEPLRKENALPRLSIDTALASESQDDLAASGVPSWCYAIDEGKFSMYIDAVGHKVGPSSYCHDDQYVTFGPRPSAYSIERLLDCFTSW